MLLKTMTVGPVETNCYLVGDEQAGACALVDPGDSAQALLSMVEESGLRLEAIFLTHGHYDHRDAVADILEKYPELPVYIHEKEKLRPGLPERYFYGGPCQPYAEGDTVQGTVRGVMDYGCFVELAPNLSGLTDQRENLREGDGVSVTIRSIRPERMKIKLQVIEVLPPAEPPETLPYWITDGVLDRWVYSPANCERSPVVTEFTEIP